MAPHIVAAATYNIATATRTVAARAHRIAMPVESMLEWHGRPKRESKADETVKFQFFAALQHP